MALSAGRPKKHPDSFSKKVLLLKNDDFERIGDQIKMPNYSEMSDIRTKEGQYKKNVEFHASMSEGMVKKNLEETFPYLKDKSFFCAAKVNVDNERSLFDFHGKPRPWDGRTIRRNIQGNSTLYVLEDDQSDTSGISGGESETTQEELSGLIQWLQQNLHFQVSICPKESRLEGGVPCRFTFNPKLHPDVTSGHATFGNLGTVQLERLNNGDLLGTIPASPVPGSVTVTLYSQHWIQLGQTVITYYGIEEFLKQALFNPSITKTMFEECNMYYSLGETTEQTQPSGILGCTEPDQLLSLLVYTAAKEGAQQFLEMIFNTSSGRVVFDAHKKRSPLPEAIARENGHEETACYLEGITKRFLKEIEIGKECCRKIDWPELVKASEAAEERLNLASGKEKYRTERNVPKETGYLGDVDTSSESSLSLSPDSEPEDDISTTLSKVLKAVLTRGPVAMEVYINALAERETLVKRVPLMLIGQAEAGKTSLKKSLKGICFNPEEESTVGIDVDLFHFKLTKEIWKVGETDQEANSVMAISFEHQAARSIANNLKERGKDSEKKRAHVTSDKSYDNVWFESAIAVMPTMTEAPLCEPSKSPDQIQTPENSAGPSPASEDSPGPSPASEDSSWPIPDDTTTFTPPEQDFEEIAVLAETLLQDEGLENKDVYSILWDFAGHSVYYVTHALFLTARAIYFLVYDLSQNPHDTAKPRVKQGVYKKFAESNLKTNLDYLDLWMASVASLASEGEDDTDPKSELLPKKLPAVFLVCTHADKPHGGRDPREKASEIFGFLKKKSYGDHLHDVFCVDNTKSGGESECPEVKRLREEVLAVSNELPHINEAIPIKWLKYENALRMLLEKGFKWISLDKAKHIASEVCKINNDDEVLTLLNFLHDLRILIHFDDTPELNQLVILDPQWLIDVFKKVITVKPRHEWKEKKFEDLWCKLEREGILHIDLVNHVWSDLTNQKDALEGLIAIMEIFGLLCCCPSSDDLRGNQYLVPSMLKSHPPEAIMKLAASAQVPSLFIQFDSGQVPAGLFPRLVLQFYQWGKEEFWAPENPKLYQNFARFFISGGKGCSVILKCHSSSIEILYHSVGDNTASFTFTRAVRRQIGLILECMCNELCWLNNMKYQMSVICPVCCDGNAVVHCDMHDEQSCNQEECLHFWSESELCGSKKSIICTKNAFAEDITEDAKVWAPRFTSPVEQVANGKHDGRLSSSYETNEENTLALPGGHQVLESILAESRDPKEVVNRLSENLEQLSLAEPDPDTKKLVRCLAVKAKCSNRLDVVKHLREITPAGTTGPLLPENSQVQRISFPQRRKLTISLSGRDEWKLVAERLGLTSEEINFLDKRTLNAADAMLGYVAQLHSITVGDLYDLLVDCELPVMADIL